MCHPFIQSTELWDTHSAILHFSPCVQAWTFGSLPTPAAFKGGIYDKFVKVDGLRAPAGEWSWASGLHHLCFWYWSLNGMNPLAVNIWISKEAQSLTTVYSLPGTSALSIKLCRTWQEQVKKKQKTNKQIKALLHGLLNKSMPSVLKSVYTETDWITVILNWVIWCYTMLCLIWDIIRQG